MGLLDSVGYIGDSLDKLGGRALRGALGGHPRELASVLPFSDSLGITDPRDIVSGRNLTDQAGFTSKRDKGWGASLLGLGADTLLDPIGLATGAFARKPIMQGVSTAAKIGGHALADLGEMSHSLGGMSHMMSVPAGGGHWPGALADAADRLGPMYGGGKEKLANLLGAAPQNIHTDRLVRGVMSSPFADQLAGEIPEGSRFLGAGTEAMAFGTPQGSVIRLGPQYSHWQQKMLLPPQGRASLPQVLQPFRSNVFGPHVVEHLPPVMPLYDSGDSSHLGQLLSDLPGLINARGRGEILRGNSQRIAEALRNQIHAAGRHYDPWDVRGHNVSLTQDGRVVIHDAGAITSIDPRNPIPWPEIQDVSPAALAAAFRHGGPDAIRHAMSEGLARGLVGQGVEMPRSFANASTKAATLRHSREQLNNFFSQNPRQSFGMPQISPASGGKAMSDEALNAMLGNYPRPGLSGGPSMPTWMRNAGTPSLALALLGPYELAHAASALDR